MTTAPSHTSPLPAVVLPSSPVRAPNAAERAERAPDTPLGLNRDERFEVDRQVAALQEAVLLYSQFLERAEGRPELEPAVRKSRERLEDAKQTIIFLTGTSAAAPAGGPDSAN